MNSTIKKHHILQAVEFSKDARGEQWEWVHEMLDIAIDHLRDELSPDEWNKLIDDVNEVQRNG
jgi:hypothetical protein